MRLPQSRRPVSRGHGKLFMYTVGAAGLLFAVLLLVIGYRSPHEIPGRSYYKLNAAFDNADNLTDSYQVRIGGRLVGQVLNPHVEHGKAVVELQLTPKIAPLRSDTKLWVRPRSPVGVRFVDLTPGTKGRPLHEGDTIPSTQTRASVQIDEALESLDAPRRAHARHLLNAMGEGFLDRGEDNNATIRSAPGFLDRLSEVAAAVNARHGAPARFVASSQGAANAADPVRYAIANGFEPEADALDVFVNHASGLRATLDTAPPALSGVRAGLARTDPLLAQTAGFAREARPMFDAAAPALRQAAALLREASPGLRATKSTTAYIDRAVPPTLRLLDTLRPVLPEAEAALRSPLGALADLGARPCDIKRYAANWDSMLAFGNSGGNVLRFNLVTGEEGLGGSTPSQPRFGVFDNPYPGPCQVATQKVNK